MRTQVDSDHGKRSGRTIDPARIDSDNHIGQADRDLLMRQLNGIYDNDRRQDACEKGMQTAARVGVMFCVLAVVRVGNSAGTICVVMVIDMCGGDAATSLHAGKRRRYHSGELGNHKEGCQHADKATYRPQPLHRRWTSYLSVVFSG
jgi:hypothetical protein